MRTQPEGFDEPDDQWMPLWQIIFALPNLDTCLTHIFGEPEFEIKIENNGVSLISLDWQNGEVHCEACEINFDIFWEYTGHINETEDDEPSNYPAYKNHKSYKYWHQAIVLFFNDTEYNTGAEYSIARRIVIGLRDAFNIALNQAIETKIISVYARRKNMDEPYRLIEPSKWGGVTIDDWMTGDAHLKGGIDLFGLMAVRGPNWPQENAVLAKVEQHSNDAVIQQTELLVRREEKSISSVWLRPDGKEPDFGKKRDQRTIYEIMRRIKGWEEGIPWSCRSDRVLRYQIFCRAHGPSEPKIVTMDRAIKLLESQGVQIWAE